MITIPRYLPRSLSLLMAAACLLAGCTVQRYVPMAGQRVMVTKKTKSCMIVSPGQSASLAVTSIGIREGKARFVVSIANRTGGPLLFSPDRVAVRNEAGRRIPLYSAQEMEVEAVRRAEKMTATVEGNAGRELAQIAQTPCPSSALAPVAEHITSRASKRLVMIGERLGEDLAETGKVLRPTVISPRATHSALLATKPSRAICFQFVIGNESHVANFIVERPPR